MHLRLEKPRKIERKRMGINSRFTILVSFLVLSCSSGEDEATFGELFLEKAEEQQTRERAWKNVSVSKLYELAADEDIVLYDPGYIIPDPNGDVYVVDYGIYEVLRFDSEGNYIRSYGDGIGRAPGEFVSIANVEVTTDSLIYVTDPNNWRISSFSKATGKFVDSRAFDRQETPVRHAITDTGIEYILRMSNKLFFESNYRGKSVEFGELLEGDPSVLPSGQLADGMFDTYKDWLVYVPFRFPVIMVYDVNGTLLRAKKTMTFDRFEEPELVPNVTNGIASYIVEGSNVNGPYMSIVGDELFLQSLESRGDSEIIVDVYEAGSVEYKYSFRIDYKASVITNDRIYQIDGDAVVTVNSYSINGSS